MDFKTDEQFVKAFDKFCEDHKIESGILIVMTDDEKSIKATCKNPQYQIMHKFLSLLFMVSPPQGAKAMFIPKDEN